MKKYNKTRNLKIKNNIKNKKYPNKNIGYKKKTKDIKFFKEKTIDFILKKDFKKNNNI